ncbi:helix-turn-helix domain containing protein [Microbacter sp. GSS18]|nr:helix-turn-helix domain containing protein [Microbacter sp. GSS18]
MAKREEILERSLEVIAREGYRGASVKELADAVGLSQAGLLHYFDSKEELFTEVLRKRDEQDSRSFGSDRPEDPTALRDGFVAVIRHNADVPGLVQLYSRLAVDAADPTHPAHRYFLQRSDGLRTGFAEALAAMQREGRLTSAVEPDTLARIIVAVADGLQLQWMQDSTIDMAAHIEALFQALDPTATTSPADAEAAR